MGNWVYDPVGLNGGAGGEAFRTIFNGSGFEAAELLAREAIQNSVDATRLGEKPEVTIEARLLEGGKFDAFWTAAELDELERRAASLELQAGNVFDANVNALRVLYIADRGTTGLCGDPTDHGSKLRKLLMEIGGSRKMVEAENTGGSFGFGKAVYAGSSRIATIFVYSRTTDEKGEPLSVLMGCAYHAAHEFNGEETTGRGFFALKSEIAGRGTRYDAFTGAKADRLAATLGLEREEGDIGTTIAILDCDLEIDAIRMGVENSWWPSVVQGSLRVELRDVDGKKIIPRPKQNPELKPFLEAMEVALGKTLPNADRSRLIIPNRVEEWPLGKLGLVVVPDTMADVDDDDDDDDLGRHSSIAMIRSPGMVVWKHRKGAAGFPPVAGVFVADDEIDPILRRSEPPEHDNWDEKASRLSTDAERRLVKALKDTSWRHLRKFQRSAQPPKPPRGARNSEIERLLSRLLGPSALRPPSGDGKHETPVSLRSNVSAQPQGGALVAKGRVVLSLAGKAKPQEVRLTIGLRAVDEDGRLRDPIALAVTAGQTLEDRGGVLTGIVALEEGKSFTFDVESAPYDRDRTLTFLPVVTPPDDMAEELL